MGMITYDEMMNRYSSGRFKTNCPAYKDDVLILYTTVIGKCLKRESDQIHALNLNELRGYLFERIG